MFFFLMQINPLKIAYWPHSHFLQARQPSLIIIWSIMLYITDVIFQVTNVPETEFSPLWEKYEASHPLGNDS